MADNDKAKTAQALTVYCVRNTAPLENIHAGITPSSRTGDFSNVFVVDATGRKIPWNDVSRISQEEMKAMMKAVVNRVYDLLDHLDDEDYLNRVLGYAAKFCRDWDDPEPLPQRAGRLGK